MKHSFVLLILASLAMTLVSASGATTYAVLGYEMPGTASGDQLSNYVAKRIRARTGKAVLSYKPATQRLSEHNCIVTDYKSGRDYCKVAGTLLEARLLVYGKAWWSGSELVVESHLVESATGIWIGHALAQASPRDTAAFSKALDAAVLELIASQQTAAERKSAKTLVEGASVAIGDWWKRVNTYVVTRDWWERVNTPQVDAVLDRVEVGFRVSHFRLLEDSERHYNDAGTLSGGYLGSITDLETEQDYGPTLYANVRILDWLAIQLGYERFSVKTVTYWDGHSDGTFDFNGPSLTAQFRYQNTTDFTPYAGLGITMLDAKFVETGWWHHGFGNPNPAEAYQNWIASGSPAWPNGGYQRDLNIVDDLMFKPIVQAGCRWRMAKYAQLDLDLRYVSLDSKLDYSLSRGGTVFSDRGASKFPMDAWSANLGILFNF